MERLHDTYPNLSLVRGQTTHPPNERDVRGRVGGEGRVDPCRRDPKGPGVIGDPGVKGSGFCVTLFVFFVVSVARHRPFSGRRVREDVSYPGPSRSPHPGVRRARGGRLQKYPIIWQSECVRINSHPTGTNNIRYYNDGGHRGLVDGALLGPYHPRSTRDSPTPPSATPVRRGSRTNTPAAPQTSLGAQTTPPQVAGSTLGRPDRTTSTGVLIQGLA